MSNGTDEKLKGRLEELAVLIYAPVNSYGMRDSVNRIIKVFENVKPDEYRELYALLFYPHGFCELDAETPCNPLSHCEICQNAEQRIA